MVAAEEVDGAATRRNPAAVTPAPIRCTAVTSTQTPDDHDWRADRVGSALRGENPTVLRRLPGGFAVMGDVQFLPGYCVLITDT